MLRHSRNSSPTPGPGTPITVGKPRPRSHYPRAIPSPGSGTWRWVPTSSPTSKGIDATLEPYEGRFVIHGGAPEAVEGGWTGDLIVITFPTRQHARDWYESSAYRQLLPLRTQHSRAEVALVDGVEPDHRAPDILKTVPPGT